MNPALNKSLEIQRFECSDAIKIQDGIMFIFYLGLPHVLTSNCVSPTLLFGELRAHGLINLKC